MRINRYGSASPNRLDVKGQALTLETCNTSLEDFYIGFEVEKNFFVNDEGVEVCERGDEVHPSRLFCNFETDASCGVEAVTNILPLGGVKSEARKSMFKLFDEEKPLINESGADTRCGGHITVSCTIKGYVKGYNLYAALRQNMALIYAMFPHRLARRYCEANTALLILPDHPKYSPVNVKTNCVEIRLPNAIRTVEQIKNRYDLLYKIMKYTVVEPITFKQLKNEVKSNLMRIYGRNESKVEQVLNLADGFHHFLVNRQINESIKRYFTDRQLDVYRSMFEE